MGPYPKTTPEFRGRHFTASKALLCTLVTGQQFRAGGDGLTLPRRPRRQLALSWAAMEVVVHLVSLQELCHTGHAHLALQNVPRKMQAHLGVGQHFLRFMASYIGIENIAPLIHALATYDTF